MNSGGLIEAVKRNGHKICRRGKFPPVNSGGLIEAWFTIADMGVLIEFPPVNSGGLIEADQVLIWQKASISSFRR